MSEDWFERVRSSIPRGFSRVYIMHLLKERAMTGKEIIEEAGRQSGGRWRPSPGLIYPLLGRLLSSGFIEEVEGGRYTLTDKGVRELERIDKIRGRLSEQFDLLLLLGTAGRYFITDIFDKMTALASILSKNVDRLSREQRERYRRFLKMELQRLDEASEKG